MKKTFIVFLMILGLSFNLNAQDKKSQLHPNSVLQASPIIQPRTYIPNDPSVESYTSRWFGVGVFGVTAVVKSFLNTPTTLTTIAPTTRAIFAGALNGAGVWYGLEYLAAGSGNLVTIDTISGSITTVGSLAGLAAGHTVTGLSWDKISSTMYGLSTDGINGTLYTVNLSNGALTTIGNTTGSALPIDMSFNNAGVLYSVDIALDVLTTLNKTTGAATTVGPLGQDLNFAQGMCFDPETDSLFLAAYNNAVSTGQLMRCNTTTGAATIIGNFGTTQAEIDGFVIPGGVARPLNPFNLQTPVAGARIVTVPGSTTPVSVTWDTSAAGANYKFIFGNPVVPPRRITIPSNSNSITTTLGALDALLAANGFTNNGSVTDSAVGQWDVWAFKGPNATGPDSLKSTNGPRAITLKRQQVTLNAFSLSAPASGISITTSPVNLTPITFSWTRSGVGATYRWLYKTGGAYSDPATFRISANNSGLDTFWTVRTSRLDSLLAGIGVAPGDSIQGYWRARAYTSTDSLNSTAPDRAITFRRAGLLPLDQDFVDVTFPPPFWSLEATGTVYWTRNAVGGYQFGVGSAKFDFWSALTGVNQSLISNQFPAVTSPTNYLRFNYSQAYYLSGGTLANDSCIIEVSSNNGATWTRLTGMGASQTLSSGTNSNGIMSTVGGPFSGAFTPTAANQWATKVYLMPVGTNKVKFYAKSDFGNNLYIDNITSGLITGIGANEITLTPEKFELYQNYPNPFNPSTKINFSIPKQGQVTLKIYNILGKEVMTLVNEQKAPGNYEVLFNAADFSSGVYFYKIESGEFSDIKRMMLIK